MNCERKSNFSRGRNVYRRTLWKFIEEEKKIVLTPDNGVFLSERAIIIVMQQIYLRRRLQCFNFNIIRTCSARERIFAGGEKLLT